MCEARYPAAATAGGNGRVRAAHVRHCRSVFVEEWRASDARDVRRSGRGLSGLQGMLAALEEAAEAPGSAAGELKSQARLVTARQQASPQAEWLVFGSLPPAFFTRPSFPLLSLLQKFYHRDGQ